MRYLFLIFIILFSAHAHSRDVSVVSWGGAYTESQLLSMGTYYEKMSGKKLNWIDYSGSLADVRANKNKWDIVDLYANDVKKGCEEGLFAKLDLTTFPSAPDGTPATDDLIMPGKTKCSVGAIFYSWVGAYDTKKFINMNIKPSSPQDFFDVNRYPGVRSLYSSAMSNLEFALVADGIHPNDVYDYMAQHGVKRALKKIKDLCKSPKGGCIYWNAGAQPPEQIARGEAVMATGWSGRFFNAAELEKANISLMKDMILFDHEYFAVVNNSNKESAIEALKYMTSTKASADVAKYIAYSPVRKSSHEIIKKNEPWFEDRINVSDYLPAATSNFPKAIVMDSEWYALNNVNLNDSWYELKISGKIVDAKIKKTNYSDLVYASKNNYGALRSNDSKVGTSKLLTDESELTNKLKLVKELLEEGLISKSDYERKKAALLGIEGETTFSISSISKDVDAPVIIAEKEVIITNPSYSITGQINDKSRVFLEVNGRVLSLNNDNSFEITGYEPDQITLTLVAFDQYGNESSPHEIFIKRELDESASKFTFGSLNPNKLKAKQNKNKIALLIGVESYKNMSDALFATRDAKFFENYLTKAIGIKPSNINTIFDDDASFLGTKLLLKKWAKRNIREDSEVYIYYSGHGLAMNDGQELYLLTNDTSPDFIEESAIKRNEIFNEIAKYNPKSVTAFLDTCYSGAGRADGEMLLAMAKGLVVVDEQQQKLPDNFTLFTAASAQESAWSLPEAQHGTFSYFLMKGMEGNADINGDKKLTNGELRDYLLDNVGRYAQQQQTPQMVGDPNQVLIKF